MSAGFALRAAQHVVIAVVNASTNWVADSHRPSRISSLGRVMKAPKNFWLVGGRP